MATGSISQDTITAAGLAPRVEQSITGAYEGKGRALEQRGKVSAEIARLSAEKSAAMGPKLDEAAAAARETPPDAPKMEKSPDYQRPTVSPDEMRESFGMLMAASMLVGLKSRQPFYDAMAGMTGAMKGFQAQDEILVKDSLAAFDRNVSAIKERNDAARADFDTAWKKYQNNLPRLKQELEIIGAKHDMPLAVKNAELNSIDSSVQGFDNEIKAGNSTLIKLQQMRDKAEAEAARLADKKEARAATAAAAGGGAGSFTQEDVAYWSEVLQKGGSLPPRLANTPGGKKLLADIMQATARSGVSPQNMLSSQAANQGERAGQRAAGTQAGRLAIVAHEMDEFIPLAEQAAAKVSRTGFVPLNKLIQLGQAQWSPEQAAFVAANRSVINTFAQLSTRGASTVHSMTEAENMLNTAATPAQYSAVLKQLKLEAASAIKAVQEARTTIRTDQGGGRETAAPDIPSGWTVKESGSGNAVRGTITPR